MRNSDFTYLVLRPLVHHLRPLLLHNHLLLAIRQRPRDTQQKRAGADNPQRLAAEQQPRLCPAGDGLVFRREGAARRCGHDVFQSGDALVQGLVGDEGGFGFEVGFLGEVSNSVGGGGDVYRDIGMQRAYRSLCPIRPRREGPLVRGRTPRP